MTLWRRLLCAALLLAGTPADAAVTITFWSRDFGRTFPHAFVLLRGTPDRGGAPVDAAYGFTAVAVTPALLFGTVAGRLERPARTDMADAFVHFGVTLTDAQYDRLLQLADAWAAEPRYNLGKRNCVHFVAAAASIAGLRSTAFPKLMKKPRAYLDALEAANATTAVPIDRAGAAWLDQPAGTSSITSMSDSYAGDGSAMRQRPSPTRSTQPATSRPGSRP